MKGIYMSEIYRILQAINIIKKNKQKKEEQRNRERKLEEWDKKYGEDKQLEKDTEVK